MNLPAAVPGLGAVMVAVTGKCWRNATQSTQQCRNEVSTDDGLGLCPEHIEELRAWSKGEA